MADTKTTYLYSQRTDERDKDEAQAGSSMSNAAAKAAAGGKVKFDGDVGAYALVTEGLNKKETTALNKAVARFTTPEAKDAWEADRAAFIAKKQADQALLKDEVRSRVSTTKEVVPAKAADGIVVYPALSQKKEFLDLLVETSSKSAYHKAREGTDAHYKVVTAVPDMFVKYQGDAAKALFEREFLEKGMDKSKNPDVEAARSAAAERGVSNAQSGRAFMAQYAERGFLLSDPKNEANHAKQLGDMRNATSKQLLSVIETSRKLLQQLRDKEIGIRSERSGLPVEQVAAMSFTQQKDLGTGLVGKEFETHSQLVRGINAINKELTDGRNVGVEKSKAPEAEKGKEAVQGEQAPKSRAQGRGPAAISEDRSAEDTLASLSSAMDRQRGRGR